MKPYTYLIKHRPTGKVYYGFRCANKTEPHEDLWKQYFTSSSKIQQLIEETGVDSFDIEIRRVFESKEQAVLWETKVLRRCKVLEDDRWINQNVAGYIVPTEESRKKISDYHKGKAKSEEHREKIRQGNIGKKKPPRTDEYRALMSTLKSGVNNPMYGKGCTLERAAKIGAANKGKTPANKGLPMSEEQKAILRETKQRNKVLLTCEVCGKIMRASHFKMYGHGPNCSQA
jgi:ssDNA-binding Zn-finger/Zn-ribbon topoisomerase 1